MATFSVNRQSTKNFELVGLTSSNSASRVLVLNDDNYIGYRESTYVELDASLSGVTYSLPEITEELIGSSYVIKGVSILNGITILPYGVNTIDGSGSYIFDTISGQSVTLQAETDDWKIISAYQPILNLDINNTYSFNFIFDELSEYIGGIYQYGVIGFTIPNDGATWSIENRNEVFLENQIDGGGGGETTGFIPDLIYNIGETSGIIYVDIRIFPDLPATFPEDVTHLEDPNYASSGYYTGYARLNLIRNLSIVKIITINYTMDLQPIL
jgi:hypothetical protein